jgi:hypothetical protein
MDKSQLVRIADIWLIAPFLAYAAIQSKLDQKEKSILLILGFLTLSYNARNYLRNIDKTL